MKNIVMRKQPSVSIYYLKYSRFPSIYIPVIRQNGNAHGFILFHWLFIGIERIRRLNGDDVSIVWNWGVRPVRKL
jgi:hypothetical protein